MNFGLGGHDAESIRPMSSAAGQMVKSRTLREQLQDQIAHHTAKIANLQEALDADVEKALNALQKL